MNQPLKKIFYTGIIGISLFEILNVYFIMPFPGSQEINSLNIAYFFYSGRWYFRIIFGLMIAAGIMSVFRSNKKWLAGVSLLFMLAIIYIFNFQMMADSMFKQPESLVFRQKVDNRVNDSSLVICVYQNGEAKGYPVEYMAYHHQVQDSVGGQPLIITYCSVCRTGRVYEPNVRGYHEKFRLVGMDHFNAMFEDATTKSWWRQSTGEAVSGPLKGEVLVETESMQFTVAKLFDLFPSALVMQQDEASIMKYDSLRKFERGLSSSSLTFTDTLSWGKKSWVIGIQTGSLSKAYDWNQLKEKQIINDKIGEIPIVLALSSDSQSFAAFERTIDSDSFTIRNDSLFVNETAYDFAGNCLTSSSGGLKRVKAYQEFWHSWQIFHPDTERYQ
jgi:hypothetical protein